MARAGRPTHTLDEPDASLPVLPSGFAWRHVEPPEARSYREADTPRTACLEQRWRASVGARGVYLMVFGCFFLAFGVFAFVTRDGWRPSPPPLFLALTIAELGAALLYVGLANVVNVTRVTITPTTVLREDGPLPWRRRRELLRSQIDVRARVTRRNDPRRGQRGLPPEAEVAGVSTPESAIVLFDLFGSLAQAERVASAVRTVMAQHRHH